MGITSEIFSRPKSEAARRLVYPDGQMEDKFEGGDLLRLVFDGPSAQEPIVANMVLEFGEAVNIIFANMQDIDGFRPAMVISCRRTKTEQRDMIRYLQNKKIKIEEVRE